MAKKYGEKQIRCYWERSREHIENLRNIFGTCWEHTQPNPSPALKSKTKKAKPRLAFSLAAWNFYFQNSLSPFSTWTDTML
jgi:hypothetical protein